MPSEAEHISNTKTAGEGAPPVNGDPSQQSDAMPAPEQEKLLRRVTLAAVMTAIFLVMIKLIAWLVTGSLAILGTTADSMLDLFASGVNFVAIRHALTPADDEHRFGHGKAEALAGMGQFALMTGSAVFLALESVQRVVDPEPVRYTGLGIGVVLVTIVVTFALVAYQRYVIARTRSLVVSADELHYRADILLNGAVLISLVVTSFGGVVRADAFFGFAIAAYLAFSAWQIFRRSINELMDREFEPEERERIKAIVMADPDTLDIHDLRTRRAGVHAFVQFHLELDPDMTLFKAHEIADRVEAAIKNAFPDADVIIHEDPAGFEEVPKLRRT